MLVSTVYLGDHKFETLVAVTPEEHSVGLMNRPWPPPVMCFPYRNAEERKFWMKSTISPLDIIFCRDNKIVSICYGEPQSTKLIGPNEPTDLVVELPYGTVAKCGIKEGDVVKCSQDTATIGADLRHVMGRLFG